MSIRICPQCGLDTTEPVCPTHQCPTILRASGSLELIQPGTVVGGRYKVDKQLGKGGFGAVFAASHVATRQELVLKILKPDLGEDPTQVQRFFNEARASSLLSHPNTVRIFDFGQTDAGLLYIAMERLNGAELAQVLKASPDHRLEPARAVRIAAAVCKSLSEAHHAGLVHRDLKPDNIFLCKVHGEEEFVKVIDFGIAKPTDAGADAGLTKTGFAVGTPKYMSPEQVTNKPLDGRSDLYALGVILYQCISGQVPLAGASPMETLVAHLQQEPQHLRERVAGLPPELTALVMRALRKHPWERFADADEMRQELENVLQLLPDGRTRPSTGRIPAVAQAGDPTAPHPEVFRLDAKPGLPPTAPQPLRPATPITGSVAVAALPSLAAQSETAILEHPTSRDAYQPSTMTLPTQPMGDIQRPAAPALQAAPGPAARSNGKTWAVIGVAAGALLAVAGVGWFALGRPAEGPTPSATAAQAAPAPARDPAPAPVRDPVRDPAPAPVRDPVRDPAPAPVRDPAPALAAGHLTAESVPAAALPAPPTPAAQADDVPKPAATAPAARKILRPAAHRASRPNGDESL